MASSKFTLADAKSVARAVMAEYRDRIKEQRDTAHIEWFAEWQMPEGWELGGCARFMFMNQRFIAREIYHNAKRASMATD